MTTLYKIDREIEDLLMNMVDEETGEVDEEKLDALNQLNIDRKEKIENCILFAKSEKADAEAILNEANALKDRATAKLNRAERTLKYVEYSLDGDEFETERCQIKYRKSQSVEIISAEAIPDKLCVFKTERKPLKADIKKLLRSGEPVPGAVLVDHRNMVVK